MGRPQHTAGPGTVIADKYRVLREVGRGGFGVVVSAIHLQLDQKVAIKILTAGPDGEAGWKEDAARFRREGQATAALRSEHVVRILDVDVLESGNPYMVMEYLEGETLHALLHTREALSIGEAVDHILQVLAALAEAHAAGIVHRDLKPANVFVTRGPGDTPVIKVLDFGMSKVGSHSGIEAPEGGPHQPITKTGALIGTVAYMAPEQMLDAKRVDARADLWSVAIMLYELLTKQTPFGPQNASTLVTTMLTKPPTPLLGLRPDAPPGLGAVLTRCLEKVPANRYATASAVAAGLAPFSTARARAALASLQRAGAPTGAAAPAEKGGPKLPGAGARAASRGKRTALIIAIVVGFVLIALAGVLSGMVLAKRRLGAPRARASASASVVTPAK